MVKISYEIIINGMQSLVDFTGTGGGKGVPVGKSGANYT